MLSTTSLLQKIKPLYKKSEYKLLIIDDTVEAKRAKRMKEVVNMFGVTKNIELLIL